MRLVVEEDGERRAFRLGKGVLVLGSGEEARLRLAAPGVAARHARLEVRGAEVELVLEPGAAPAAIDGVPMAAERARLAPGRRVQLGGALLWLEADATDAAASPARAAPAVARAAGASARPLAVRRAREPAQRGLPAWALVSLALLALATLLIGGWAVFSHGLDDAPAATTLLEVAQAKFDQGRLDEALARLDLLERGEADAATRAGAAALRASIEGVRERGRLAVEGEEALRLLRWLEEYEKEELAGAPDPARVRLFLKRARQFRERWPAHPSLEWVERMVSRFEGQVDLDQPPDWPAVRWEARSFTRGLPRDYRSAFALVDDFLARVPAGQDHDEAVRTRRLLVVERGEHHADRMQTARGVFAKGEAGRAVWWLVHQVIWSGDPALADEAARVLIKMPDAFRHLDGYREAEPEKFAQLMENETVSKFYRAAQIGG